MRVQLFTVCYVCALCVLRVCCVCAWCVLHVRARWLVWRFQPVSVGHFLFTERPHKCSLSHVGLGLIWSPEEVV